MAKRKPYQARSLAGAVREVRMLRKRIERTDALLEQYAADRKLMARLAADTPQFDNPLVVIAAKSVRDRILENFP